MGNRRTCIVFSLWMMSVVAVSAESLVERLLAQYNRIESVSCDVRRDLSNQDGQLRWLSRVYFQRPDLLHVENYAPLPRRILADGQTMYQHNEGQPRGFRNAIENLNDPMLFGLRKVPGTVMEHLFRIQGVDEEVLENGEGAYPIRRGYAVGPVYVILAADENLRLGRVELYDAQNRDRLTGEIDCESFVEVMDGVWIAMVHRGRFVVGGMENREVTRLSNYAVNNPIPANLFNADVFFQNVEWVDRFDDL